MKLKEAGRYLELPIAGLTIKELVFDGRIKLVFNDDEHSYLDLHSVFNVTQHGQTKVFDPKSKEALMLFYDHFTVPVKQAKADKYGVLWLTFDNGTEIHVEDGPYENWHYTKIISGRMHDCLHVHGGVGRTVY